MFAVCEYMYGLFTSLYENQLLGYFVMYRHTVLLQEVGIFPHLCSVYCFLLLLHFDTTEHRGIIVIVLVRMSFWYFYHALPETAHTDTPDTRL